MTATKATQDALASAQTDPSKSTYTADSGAILVNDNTYTEAEEGAVIILNRTRTTEIIACLIRAGLIEAAA
jgi:hypothetical protein